MMPVRREARAWWASWGVPAAPGREARQRLLRRWRRTSLVSRSALIGLLMMVLIDLALGLAIGRQLQREALELTANRTAETVRVAIEPILRLEDFEGLPSTGRIQAIEQHLERSLTDGRIVKINIWNADGRVLYSTDSTLIGKRFDTDEELRDALSGRITMDLSNLSKEENQGERGRFSQLMEIYAPIRLGGDRVVGAYEVYREAEELTRTIAVMQRLFWIGLALGLGALYLALFGILRSASRQLQRQSEELARHEAQGVVERLTTEFVSIVSHELRTPLTALVGFSELLLTQSPPAAEQREWTENIHAAARRLSALVEDLLDVSRIEEGRVELKRQPVALRGAVNEVLAELRHHAPMHRFEEQYGDPLPPLLVDPDKLSQILTNLITNAVKYSPEGGPITITAFAANGNVHLSVADRGLGLPAAELPRIFERFHRILDESRRQIPGTGLGLYITRRLVELQDGRIWAESAGPGAGSTFRIELPAVSEDPHA
jgi:signal transduction histidine kinase